MIVSELHDFNIILIDEFADIVVLCYAQSFTVGFDMQIMWLHFPLSLSLAFNLLLVFFFFQRVWRVVSFALFRCQFVIRCNFEISATSQSHADFSRLMKEKPWSRKERGYQIHMYFLWNLRLNKTTRSEDKKIWLNNFSFMSNCVHRPNLTWLIHAIDYS